MFVVAVVDGGGNVVTLRRSSKRCVWSSLERASLRMVCSGEMAHPSSLSVALWGQAVSMSMNSLRLALLRSGEWLLGCTS